MFKFVSLLLFSVASLSFATPLADHEARDVSALYSGTQFGQATFFATGLGACGLFNSDSDFIAAASATLFDNFPGFASTNPNNNPMCGQVVTITNPQSGASVSVSLVDRCVACGPSDLDLSPAAFSALADLNDGRINISWSWRSPPE